MDSRIHTKLEGLNDFQQTIVNCVENYKTVYPLEYTLVVNYLKERRKDLKTQFAEIEAPINGVSKTTYIERGLYEIPETLQKILDLTLPIEGVTWLRTKIGARWFAHRYREFLSGDKD